MEKQNRSFTTVHLARAGIIAALYVAVTYLFAFSSYLPLQVRVAEALTLLPILFPEAIVGLTVGCLIANILGPYGAADIVFGSLATLIAACLTYAFRRSYIAYLSPILINAFFVSLYLNILFEVPYWPTVLSIGAGQSVAIFVLGVPMLYLLRKHEWK